MGDSQFNLPLHVNRAKGRALLALTKVVDLGAFWNTVLCWDHPVHTLAHTGHMLWPLLLHNCS